MCKKVERISFFRFLTAYKLQQRPRKKTGAKVFHNNSKTNHSNLWFLVEFSVQFLYLGVFGTWGKLVSFINNKGGFKGRHHSAGVPFFNKKAASPLCATKASNWKVFFRPIQTFDPTVWQTTHNPTCKRLSKVYQKSKIFSSFFTGFYEFFYSFSPKNSS